MTKIISINTQISEAMHKKVSMIASTYSCSFDEAIEKLLQQSTIHNNVKFFDSVGYVAHKGVKTIEITDKANYQCQCANKSSKRCSAHLTQPVLIPLSTKYNLILMACKRHINNANKGLSNGLRPHVTQLPPEMFKQ